MPVYVPTIDASAAPLNLEMTEGDFVSFNFLVEGEANWASSTWVSRVRRASDPDSNILGEFTITAVPQGLDVNILMTSTTVNLLAANIYDWDMAQVGGVTRFTGQLIVKPSISW